MNKQELNMLAEMHTDIKYIKKAMYGNGKGGLIDRVDKLEKWKSYILGGITVLALFIGWGISIIY